MPIYDLHCPKCGHEFETICKQGESVDCPACKDMVNVDSNKRVSSHGGYHMFSGPSSIRPKGAGSFKKGRK